MGKSNQSLTKMQIAAIGAILAHKSQRANALDEITFGRSIEALKKRGLITPRGRLTRGAILRYEAYKRKLEASND
jgi:hypothetical protein